VLFINILIEIYSEAALKALFLFRNIPEIFAGFLNIKVNFTFAMIVVVVVVCGLWLGGYHAARSI